jgi:hypothetical protein
MDQTADKSTSLRTPWREARKRAGSLDELRQYLHTGRIPAHHDGLRTLPDGKMHSGPGILRPEMWAHAYEDRAGRRVIFITEEVADGPVVQEQVFAYDSSIELDSVAFDAVFPVAGIPPAEQHPGPSTTPAERAIADPASAAIAPKNWLPVARRDHPRRRNELLVDYAGRLRVLMQKANVTKVWPLKTLLRRLHDK